MYGVLDFKFYGLGHVNIDGDTLVLFQLDRIKNLAFMACWLFVH